MSKFTKKYYTGDDTFVCPAGVTNVWLIGCGGGGGGGGGRGAGSGTNGGGGGGGAAIPSCVFVTVVPGTSYTVTIGTGVTGGTGQTNANGNPGNVGTNTTFGSLATFMGGGGGGGGGTTAAPYGYGGTNVPVANASAQSIIVFGNTTEHAYHYGIGYGGIGAGPSTAQDGGQHVIANQGSLYAGGTNGTTSSTWMGGGGGGAGSQGAGANGGNGNSAGTGSNGSNAAANTGAGGGGGGSGNTTGGNGGNGGSGYLYVIWIE